MPPKPRGKVPGRVWVVVDEVGDMVDALSTRGEANTMARHYDQTQLFTRPHRVVKYVPAGRAAVDSKGGK